MFARFQDKCYLNRVIEIESPYNVHSQNMVFILYRRKKMTVDNNFPCK